MSEQALALAVGILANIATFGMIVPQVARLARAGRIAGVSPTWAATGATINLGWLAYVVHEGVWMAVPAVAAAIVSFGLTFHLLGRRGATLAPALAAAAGLLAVLAVVLATTGWLVLGTSLAIASGIQHTPSVVTAWRSDAPAGVSPATWFLIWGDAGLWAAYGALIQDGPIVMFGVTGVASASAVLIRLWVTRHRIRSVLEARC